LAGDLNLVAMIQQDDQEIEEHIRTLLSEAARGGGFIITDSHGEIPWQISDKVLKSITSNINKWGTYPLKG
jgi:uroporphyrinogen decarboxylase